MTPLPPGPAAPPVPTRRDRRLAARRARIRRVLVVLAVVVLVGTVAGATRSATAATSPPAPRAAASATLVKPAVPQHSAYLGAFVAPHLGEVQAQADVRQELAQLGNFDGAMGRPLGLVHVYQAWGAPVRPSILAALTATGATPFIDWTCTSDASVINGSQDATITAYADSLKAYGRPVLLRWFWEMNLTNLPRTSGCLGALGATGYVQAWQHIWTIFQNEGAANVAFVWCPSIQGTNYAAPYYPGDSYVDWIGWDGYDRKQSASATLAQFQPFYAYWVTHGKPLVIGETGATTDQATYLAALATALPAQFPQIRAVLYYDSKATSDWTLVDAPGDLGADQFAALGQTPYFGFPYVGS